MPRGRKRAQREATEDHEGDTAIAESFQAKRTNSSTKRAYASKIRVMTAWLCKSYPDVVSHDESIQLPLPKDAILGFFGHLCKQAHQCDKDGESTSHQPMSVSCVKGYRSALVDLYRNRKLEIDPNVDGELRRVLDGYDKTINSLKQRGIMDINEGKRHLKSKGYNLLATKLMTATLDSSGQTWSNVVFAWSFFVIVWNLMSRSDSVEKIMLHHLDWVEDALSIEEQGHKGDQTGADKFGKHVYANPYEPWKCPILALSVLLFTYPDRLDGKHQLFVGTDNKGRFGRTLRRILMSLSDHELQALGCDAQDIGTHSLRKGSSTYALAQINGPTPVSVYLRMGQSLGRLKDRYIHFGEGADQLCGRMICGLPFDSERFTVLPPHFDPSVCALLTNSFWRDLVSGYELYPRAAQSILPYLLASIIHHEQYLRENLDSKHPIFTSRLFSANPLLNCLRNSTFIAIAIAKRVADLTAEIEKLKSDLKSLPALIADKVTVQLREIFAIDGVLPLTLRDVSSMIQSLRNDLMSDIRQRNEPNVCEPTANVAIDAPT
ncbi:hypothetical protein Ae201684P_013259 [Aphanomyces euteiches]|uniref:Uncharacterized protein n=1 Tax=Aphanomyces euteiches TaxID=100861 RepID=A0A6G0WSC8_9STRA|nr:hypothetical protein Ae201684_012374 [Aphanomyces euteiches]KAH9096593.1 hypothetical protein Ae201684P_013259 [Aphanomyces euteiches]